MLKSEEGDLDQVKKILTEKHENNINAVNRNGYTALSLAVKGGYYRIANVLIEAGADINIKNNVNFNNNIILILVWTKSTFLGMLE